MLKWLGNLRDSNEREIQRLQPLVDKINALEPDYAALDADALRAKTDEFRARLAAQTAELESHLAARRAEESEALTEQAETDDASEKELIERRLAHLRENINGLIEDIRQEKLKGLDGLLPEAFAAVREAAKRNLGQRHYDVQLVGGMILHQGKIAEMRTGEGKTLVATLPLYLNALAGEGCHLATVNDYLARRDPYWMGPIYHALGLAVASIYPTQTSDEQSPARLYDVSHDSGDPRWRHFKPVSRAEAYRADITYGTSAEFGFDFLRDNMVSDIAQRVQRQLHYSIVDEIDNLLIDEARTPLIISAPDVEAGKKYLIFAKLVRRLKIERDYEVKEKERTVEPTDEGYSRVEELLEREKLLQEGSLYDTANVDLMRHLRNALSAKETFRRDRDYVVTPEREVVIVDEFTGRLMVGRRYSEGLHQAIEAKEGVPVQEETKTYATVTIQNYFRMYRKLAGMTGTAVTEAEEFHKIYKLDVVVVPTHRPMIREDHPDLIYRDEKSKFRAVAEEVEALHQAEHPVLIGTVSIEKSEALAAGLKKRGIPHRVLNAKQHTEEAEIIAGAGKPGMVTIATNMAGRGVDIVLGGKQPDAPEQWEYPDAAVYNSKLRAYETEKADWQMSHQRVIASGGLHVVGTERHEARRIDNQLRGRAGRQGDPGQTRFFVSLEDDVMRRFGGERIQQIMGWAGLGDDVAIENSMVSKAIENAQTRVEGYHFDMRKHLVEYDDVINRHREVIYGERDKILRGVDLKANIRDMLHDELGRSVMEHAPDDHGIDWDTESMYQAAAALLPLPPELTPDTLAEMKREEIIAAFQEAADRRYDAQEAELTAAALRGWERRVMLGNLDSLWMEHLTAMEYMRQGIGLQSLAQRDPLVAYKREGHQQFQNLLMAIRYEVAHTIGRSILHPTIVRREAPPTGPSPMAPALPGSLNVKARAKPAAPATATGKSKKVGRNEPCPCGSGKKYKHCCGG